MKTVLSTKILTLPQKELLLNAGIGLVEYDALSITFIDFELPKDSTHIIVTSKNGAKAFLKAYQDLKNTISKEAYSFYCVGEKTRKFLEDSGFLVVESAISASELGVFILEKHKTNRFIFICGNLRREELPLRLSENNVRYTEFQGYTTSFKEKEFSGSFDGILFYSPSGIKSFLTVNNISKSPLFCIGETTASEAKKYSEHIIIAKKPTVENVLVQVIKCLNDNDKKRFIS